MDPFQAASNLQEQEYTPPIQESNSMDSENRSFQNPDIPFYNQDTDIHSPFQSPGIRTAVQESNFQSSQSHPQSSNSIPQREDLSPLNENSQGSHSTAQPVHIPTQNKPQSPDDEYNWGTSPVSINFFHSRVDSMLVSDLGASPPSQSSSMQTMHMDDAVKEFKNLQNRKREDDLVIKGLPVASADVPVVHPRLVKTSFFEGDAAPLDDEYRPSIDTLEITWGDELTFDRVLEMEQESKYIALIGYPGSGKTTCSKRLAKSSIYLCFHLYFMSMNYEDEKLTLKKLLLDTAYPDFDDYKRSLIFQWVRKNQEQVAIIIDGFDQVEWKLNSKAPKHDYETPQRIENLISSLFNRHLLADVRLIITSRPHSVISMPPSLRPNLTLFLRDLTFKDMKTLFFTFAQEDGETLWKKINTSAPQLISFCFNPMMLQFCVQASLRPSERVGEITTVTRIFATVIENLRRCDNVTIDIRKITLQLGRIAFDATVNGTVLITISQLTEENLVAKEVQDLVIEVVAAQGLTGLSSRIFEGDTKLYFSHQSLQEYFTATHIVKQLSFEDFYDVIEHHLFTARWSMVRKFVSGLLIDMKVDGKDVERKKTCFLRKFNEVLDKQSRDKNFDDLVDSWIDIRECNKDDMVEQASRLCPDVIDFSMQPLTASQTHAISTVLRKISKSLKRLDLYSCSMDDYSFKFIIDAIQEMPGTIQDLSLIGNNFSEEAISYLCSVLHKIKHQITMWDAFDYEERDRNATAEEMRTLQTTLNGLSRTDLEVKISPDRQPLRKNN